MSKQTAAGGPDDSTLAGLEPGRRARTDDAVRYAFLAFIIVVVLLSLTDRLGPRAAAVTDANATIGLEVRYDQVVRAGLGASWSIEVTSRGGEPLPDQLTLVTTSEYLGLFDENGLSPEPVEETTSSSTTTWVFEPEPQATSLLVELDARVQPGWRAPVSGTTTLVVEGEEPLHVDYRTWSLP